ncbi:MAG: peptidylprolyl isomerase [Bernardetiaceae bacterium]|nr:peptidylprolyl isomerase [Bernardetiaceae bacterium]
MSIAKKGDLVKVNYTGKLEDGTVFDASENHGRPLEFIVGAGQMIKGFDLAVESMKIGEQKTVTLSPSEAYGEVKEEYLLTVNQSDFPDNVVPNIGDRFTVNVNNSQIPVSVKSIDGDAVVLDANNELAGKTLVFDIELVDVQPGDAVNRDILPD